MLSSNKLQVTFTKQLGYRQTFKGHCIITYLNHSSTKIHDKYPESVSDLDIFKEHMLFTVKHCIVRLRKPRRYRDIKSRYLR